ncbi:MAG: hypothetical protein J6K15_08380 [Lachnospiraceae bacterium]|nr:hypothetical protein [Lachnospiraceae bacterium]MBP3578109.1 hypothetical protein [Lachnospiraceae bacterium]
MEESILHGGEKELLELKKTLQEKNRYNAVLDSMDAAVDEQKLNIEKRKAEIEKEMNLEVIRRREAVAAPFYTEIAACEAELKSALEERSKKRIELIAQIMQEENEMYEKRKENLENQRKLVGQTDGVPGICTTRLFLAFFCPRSGKDALILVIGLLVLFLILPLSVYFGVYGGNNRSMLTTIYLVFIVIFYTLYLLINNLVKDKYLIGINKLLKIMEDLDKLEANKKKREKELENLPDSALDLGEFDEEVNRLQAVIEELTKQKDLAVMNFDSDERLHVAIGQEVQEKFKPELDHMRAVLQDHMDSYERMQVEYNKFLDDRRIEERYGILLQAEPDIFSQTVIDELIFYITHSDAENISKAIIKRKKKLGQPMSL